MAARELLALDFPEFIRIALRPAGANSSIIMGTLSLNGRTFIPKPSQRLTAQESFVLGLKFKEDEDATVTGVLLLISSFVSSPPLVILFKGIPIGFGEYAWRAYCPAKKTFVSVLYLDPSSLLFVSRKAVGGPPPRALHRKLQCDVMTGLFSALSDDLLRSNSQVVSAFDPTALTEVWLETIRQDRPLAQSGLPMAQWDNDGDIDILATVENSRGRDHFKNSMIVGLLKQSLKEPKPPKANSSKPRPTYW